MIGVAGGTASGKSSVCKLIMVSQGKNEVNNSQTGGVIIAGLHLQRARTPGDCVGQQGWRIQLDPGRSTTSLWRTVQLIFWQVVQAKIPVVRLKTNSVCRGVQTIYPATSPGLRVFSFLLSQMRDCTDEVVCGYRRMTLDQPGECCEISEERGRGSWSTSTVPPLVKPALLGRSLYSDQEVC